MAGIILGLASARAEKARVIEETKELLAIFGERLLPRQDRLAMSLSYANRRRLEIARALATRPRLLLLDEPAAGMNPTESRELMADILRIRERGVTVLLIEHDMTVVRGISDRVVALDHGVKIAEGDFATVRKHPHVVEAYLGRRAANA
jgi:ABC-type branched-subunit amino acid transport system ATPase component